MITPQLENLILCGKAFFKTFVAGGDKHTLTFGNDRYIIITDITYFPMSCEQNEQNTNTQVSIYGERGYNHYIFRNYYSALTTGGIQQFVTPVTINTFILHEQQVGFSFSNAPFLLNGFVGIADTRNPGYAPPLDYGIDGQPGAVPVLLTADALGAPNIQNNFVTRPTAGTNESQQLFFPVDASNSFGSSITENSAYPLMLVNYVEVLGQPGNIQI
jgi:hypothetical protein